MPGQKYTCGLLQSWDTNQSPIKAKKNLWKFQCQEYSPFFSPCFYGIYKNGQNFHDNFFSNASERMDCPTLKIEAITQMRKKFFSPYQHDDRL